MAIDANRYVVQNGNSPTAGNITEEKESEMEEFVDYAKIIMGTLGYKVFDAVIELEQSSEAVIDTVSEELILYLKRKTRKSGRIIEARCKQTSEGFVVLSGSTIEAEDSDSISTTIKEKRKRANIDGNNILQENILFNSPSYAASFVIGKSANGLTEWKTADGKTFKDYEAEKE